MTHEDLRQFLTQHPDFFDSPYRQVSLANVAIPLRRTAMRCRWSSAVGDLRERIKSLELRLSRCSAREENDALPPHRALGAGRCCRRPTRRSFRARCSTN